jgi:DNA-binding LytR/AlgR family response regulator
MVAGGMKPLRVLIVDDEPLARRRLVQLLAGRKDVEIVGEADGGREALELVALLRPDVLLLDIQMPAVDGFAVLKGLPQTSPPAIIFVTAFQDHAATAFELRATDFVVKPVRAERLDQALDQARSDLDARRVGERLAFLQNAALTYIRWQQSERDYVRVHMDGQAHLVNGLLGDMEKALDKDAFLRVHRSAIVRKDKVRAVLRGRFSTPILELDDGHRLPVGRKYRDAVRSAFNFGE